MHGAVRHGSKTMPWDSLGIFRLGLHSAFASPGSSDNNECTAVTAVLGTGRAGHRPLPVQQRQGCANPGQ